jgi:putative transposase
MRGAKKGRTDLREERVSRYEFIEKASGGYPLRVLLEAAVVSRTAYYGWLSRHEKAGESRAAVRAAVRDRFYFHKRTYGAKRLSDELKEDGVKAGRYLIRRIMSEERLLAKCPKPYRPRTTDSKQTKVPSPNLLKEVKNVWFGAGEVVVGDITYLPMTSGRFCYLATFQDVRTKRVVGWDVRSRMPAELVCEALNMGLRRGLIKPGAIVHTDRGSQYASNDYRKVIGERLRQSMSAKGNCYDNAQAESFFSRFKTEIDVKLFSSVEEARSIAFDYIECYYNRVRRHTTLGMTIPMFEKQLKESCGNAAHVEIAENLKRGLPQFPQSLGKAQSGFPTFPQPRLLDTNQKGEIRDFFVLKT